MADRVSALRATPLALTPDGPTLATLETGTSGQVIGRSGEWVQVQLQGWVREADLAEPVSAAIPGVTVAQIRADPSKYVGQLLEWRVQYISIQTADELRPEIPGGAKYLLTRGPLPEPGFVYVIVTAAAVADVSGGHAAPGIHGARPTPGRADALLAHAGAGTGPGGGCQGRDAMNDVLMQRIQRKLESLSDERGYQILDYVEFLESKFAERASPSGIFAKFTETVEDTMRAGKLPIQAISGTMGVMDSAAKVMKGFAAAGKTVVDEAMRASEGQPPLEASAKPAAKAAAKPAATKPAAPGKPSGATETPKKPAS